MSHESSFYQRTERERKKNKIIKLLTERAMRFKDLRARVKFSHNTLSLVLRELSQENKIVLVKDKGAKALVYTLTAVGKGYSVRMWTIDEALQELRDQDALYIPQPAKHIYQPRTSDEWPHPALHSTLIISPMRMINGGKAAVLPRPNCTPLEDLIVKQMLKHLHDKRITITKPIEGKAILAIEINYKALTSLLKKRRWRASRGI